MNDLLTKVNKEYIDPIFAVLPKQMDTVEARLMLLSIGLQESRFTATYQKTKGKPDVKGPARGYWQFEKGTRASRGGVWGVYLHDASRYWLSELCKHFSVKFDVDFIYAEIEVNPVFAAGVARCLLFTDGKKLPQVGKVQEAWDCYTRNWRPGKPHRNTWDSLYDQARKALKV